MKKWVVGLMVGLLTVSASAQLEIGTALLPEGDVGLPYIATMTATNGTPPYEWSWSRPEGNIPYSVSRQVNSFNSGSGVAQNWMRDWGSWYLAFPFSFPFSGESFTYCYVSANGRIHLGNYDGTINVMSDDLDTTYGNVYVDSSPTAITIRWAGHYSGQYGDPVSFSLTLFPDGTFAMKYGGGNYRGGEIALWSNTSYYLHSSSWNNMGYAQNIVFSPAPVATVIPGLSISTNGIISGVPTEPYDDGVVVSVEDFNGIRSSRWFELVIHDDRDLDGLPDAWERIIVDDNLGDAITDVFSVLRDDNYDGDDFSNIEEFLLDFDPVTPDGDPLDTLDEGLQLVARALTNDLDRVYFQLIDDCFTTVLAAEPTNHSARVYRALSRLLNLINDEDVNPLIEQFGASLSGNFIMTGEFNFDTALPPDAVSDRAFSIILPAIDASFADLEMIPTNWRGTVEISTHYFPIDETVYADIGDLTAGKALLKGARSMLLLTHAQQLNVDYEKMILPVVAPQTTIIVDGNVADWADVPVQLLGELDSAVKYVKSAWNGSSVYFMMALADSPYDLLGADVNIQLAVDSEIDAASYPVWNYTNVWFSATGTNTAEIITIVSNNMLEVEIPVPPSIAVSNACITDAWAQFGEFVDYGGYGFWQQRDGADLESPASLPVDVFKQNHPEFLQTVRSEAEMVAARTNLQEAIDLGQLADDFIQARTDMLMHFIEYDPANETDRMEIFARIKEGEDSLSVPVQLVVTNDIGEVIIDERVHLGALYQSPYLSRSMAPEFWETVGQPMIDTLPDPTLGGVFPNMTEGRKLAYLWKIEAPTDWDDDGLPNGWELRYYGNPTNAVASADGDGDGQSAGDEFLSGSDPTNGASFFKAAYSQPNGAGNGIVISWQSEDERVYDVHWSPLLTESFQLLAAGIIYPQNSYTDTVHAVASQGYYRVVARIPGGNDLDADGLPDDWEGMYFVDYSADATGDGDGDGQDNINEFIAGTDPRDPDSYFAVTSVDPGAVGFVVGWVSVPDRSYSVKWAPAPGAQFRTMETGLAFPANSYTDTVHGVESEGFYRIGVEAVEPPSVEGAWKVDTYDGQPLSSGMYIHIDFYSDDGFGFYTTFESGSGTYSLEGNALQMNFFNGYYLEGTVEGGGISGTLYESGTPHAATMIRR